ncbi:hypothetical protein BX070DRAFT_143889 [Coemansia spiralis]|nr:hypothetical protein BX070DRAFT_143889 [Coemansia spiralis]
MSASTSRIERFISNLRQNLKEGNYYEGHQELRAIAIRLVKQKKHSRAIQLLYLGALELCQYNQWGSVADLAAFMINIYVEEKLPVTSDNKERVYDIFEKLSQATEYYPRVYESAIQWTIGEKHGVGDSQMHHIVGCIQRGKARYQEAEQHFLVGTAESPLALGSMLFDWAARTSPQHDLGLFIARGVLKYLALGWREAACLCYKAFAAKMAQALPAELEEQHSDDQAVQSAFGPIYYCKTHVLFNFTQLLLLTVERSDGSPASDSTRILGQIRNQYGQAFGTNADTINELLDIVGEKFFGIVVHRQQSLFDIVNSLFASPSQPQIENTSAEAMD